MPPWVEPASTSRRSLFTRRLSNASLLTISSITTLLPEYSAIADNDVRTVDSPPAFETEESDQPSSPLGVAGQSDIGSPSGSGSEVVSPFGISPDSGSFPSPSQDHVVNPRRSILLTPNIVNTGRSQPIRDSSEFQYSFPIRSGNCWAKLQLYTRDAVPGNPKPLQSQPKVPRLWSCDALKGVLQLDLDNPQVIQQISLVLRGKIATSSMDGGLLQFMRHEFTVWKTSFGDPSKARADSRESSKERFNGKFFGKYSFPFSFPLPTHVDPSTKSTVVPTADSTTRSEQPASPPSSPTQDFTGKGKKTRFSWPLHFGSSGDGRNTNSSPSTTKSLSLSPQTERISRLSVASPLPQTFSERGVVATVSYDLSVLFVHGRFKPDSRIKTSISYSPALQPFPASLKRRQAYEAAAPTVPHPFSDPDGWFSLPEVPIVGIFDSQDAGRKRSTAINCKLYVAEPLSYTRGATIPCFLSLSSDDAEALQWLASPQVPVVRLMRHIHHFVPRVSDPYEGKLWFDANLVSFPSPLFVPGTAAIGEKLDLKLVSHEVATAVWWPPSKDVSQETLVRHLEGEIHLSVDQQPSCVCEIFRVEYVVQLLSLQSAYFEPQANVDLGLGSVGKDNHVWQTNGFASVPVEVTTLYRQDEAIPVSYSEPPKVLGKMRPLSADIFVDNE